MGLKSKVICIPKKCCLTHGLCENRAPKHQKSDG